MSQRKVQAGGHIRTSLDNGWRTPEHELDAVRAYADRPIPFDPASAPDNPTKALRFCAAPPGTLFEGKPAANLFELMEPRGAGIGELVSANGLEVEWHGRGLVFVNPPYGRELRAWLTKIAVEAKRGCEIIALLPASRWEMPYMHRVLREATAVCYPIGRIAFISSIDGAPCGGNPGASQFLGFNVDRDRFSKAFDPLGLVQFTSVTP